MRTSTSPTLSRFLVGAAGLALAVGGYLLLTDRAGLRLEYHALPLAVPSDPVFTELAVPQIESRADVADVLVSQELFGLRWRGWLVVDKTAEYLFLLAADESAYLRINEDQIVAARRGARRAQSEPLALARGLHEIEIGFSQTAGPARMSLRWGEMGAPSELLAGRALVGQRPAHLRALLRRRMGSESRAAWVLAVALLGFGVLLLILLLKRWCFPKS